MSFLTRAKDLWGQTRKAPQLLTSVVEHDTIDEYVHKDLLNQAAGYRDVMTNTEVTDADGNTTTVEWAPDTWGDIFNVQHNVQPNAVMHDLDKVRPSHRLSHEIMGHYVETEDFHKSKPHTMLDRTTAGLVSMAAVEVLNEELVNGALKEQAEQAQHAAEIEQQMIDAQDMLDHLRERAAEQGFASDEQKAGMKAAAQDKADARHALETIVKEMDAAAPLIDAAAREIIAKAAGEGAEMGQVWTAVAGTQPGAAQVISPDKALELALRWKDGDTMQRIAIKAGRVLRDMKGERRRNIKGGREERIGIKTGNDLSLLVSSQLVRLSDERLRPGFFKNYVDRSLLIHDTQSEEDAGHGPVVVLIDVSGTMGGRNAERNEWAKAVMMALVALAQRDGRAVYVIAFDSEVQAEWEFGRKPDLETLTDAASFFTGGGTNIHAALARGAELIDRHEKFSKADMVLVTDGQSQWREDTDALRDHLRERGVMTHGVSIGMPATNNWMTEFCDTAVEVTDLDGPNEATTHLALATI